MKKKLLSILLCLCMVMALLPTTALAAGEGAGSTSISNFKELKDAFRDGGEYTLAANITVTEQLTLESGKTLTIHGNKKTIQPEVTGLNEQGIVNTGASAIDNIIKNSGILTLENLTIYGGKGRCIYNAGTLTMTGVSLERAHLISRIEYGAGLYNDMYAKALLTNCNIRRNGCESSGGGFCNYSGTLILENCAIVENRNFGETNGGGAGENKGPSAKLYMNNCTVANNQSSEIGGGLNNYSGTAYIMNSTFTGNVTTASQAHEGGGIGNNQGTVYAVNSVFAFNYANGVASDIGICNSSSTNVYLYNCAYGTIRKYPDSLTLSGIDSTCQKLTGDVSSLFNGARNSGIVDQDGVENTSKTFARPVITQEDSTYGVYPAESSALRSGGTTTYYDRAGFTVNMSYDNSNSTKTDLVGTATTVVTGPESSARAGLIGAMPANFAITRMYTVKVNPAVGGTVTGGSAQGNSYPAGTTGIQITAVPSTGYAFSGWKVNGATDISEPNKTYTINDLAGDVTLTPVFVEANTYTVTYLPGTNGTGDKKTDTKTKDVDLTLQGVTFTRTGYTQTGWATSDGGDKAYDLGGTYSDNTAVSLYPVWTANNYDISLSQAGTHTFTAATVGYSTAPAALSVTVTNTGNQPTGALTVALSGTNADSFTLGDVDDGFTDGIETQDGTDTFTVKPKTGLAVGTYTATVTVSGTNIVPKSFNVSFTVSAAPAPSSGGSYTPPSYKVESEASKDDDGSVSVSKSNAKKGDTVTITVTPDRYYKVDGVTVKDKNGKEIAVTDNGDGTFTFKMPASKVTVEPVFSWDNPFADVAEDTYYTSAVEWALKNDITNGAGDDTTFGPDAECTRAQIVTFLWRAAGCPEPAGISSFTDVSADAYYAKAVAWAVEQGITNGTGDGTTFSPDATCTRSQGVTFLYRSAGSPEVSDDIAFNDVTTGSYYSDAVVWATQNGVTDGTGNSKFSPVRDCTRAQIVTFLYRWMVK